MTTTREVTKPVKPPVRCAIYTRKSSEEGLEQEFNSLDAQRESAEAYIASQKAEGWTCLSEHYDDGGFTGGNMDRPGLAHLLEDIDGEKIDCVVVYKVDRLSRSLMDFARIVEVFDKHHVSFVSVTQAFNTTHSMGRLTLNILLSFAQFEREIIGERIRDKLAAQRRRGKWAGGFPVLGYNVDRNGNSPKLVIDAAEAAQVREIFRLYLELGSLLPVVQELARRGWSNKIWTTRGGKRRGGKVFDKCSVYNLLTNPIYIGKIRHKTEFFAGEHEPIVALEVFEKVQHMLHEHGTTGGREARNRYGALLRGLLYCKSCGRNMVHTYTAKEARRYRYYTCTQALKQGRETCALKSLPAAEIERVVVEEIVRIGKDRELRADVLRQAKAHLAGDLDALQIERRQIVQELARHHAEIRKLASSVSNGNERRIADLHDRVGQSEERLREIVAEITERESRQVDQRELAAVFDDFDGVWKSMNPREQANLLALLVSRIEYNAGDGTIAIAFHDAGIKSLAQQRPLQEAA